MDRREVWITGVGIVCAHGDDVATVAEAQREGRSGAVALADSFDTTHFDVLAACRVPDADPAIADLKADFGLRAARAAISDAFGEDAIDCRPDLVGVHLASGLVSTPVTEAEDELLASMDAEGRYQHAAAAARLADPSPWRARHFTDRVNRTLTTDYGIRGPSLVNHGACAASAVAIGLGARWIERGTSDVVLAGGYESMIHPFGVLSFGMLGALSERQDCSPAEVSRPFDATRDGFVIGEGGAVLVLEDARRARARGARCWGRVLGMGTSMDAYRVTAPAPDGHGAVAAMRQALSKAGLGPDEIDYINAHGTGTPLNDATETAAVKQVFGGKGEAPPMSSSKSALGHSVAAAGAVEAVLCLLAMRDGVIPPTLNLTHPDPDCDLDCVPLEAREAELTHVVSNSFGFGGVNCSLALGATP
ncbi:MAG: beta-ketoacyl-[acyl-carrier-protein] synthase family protein [Proteobacteria bacterium]|nr:beta-ketoacyl-[acyl-carrier-protein] synthase family protein [Pseudomonadota bacterium]